jgi:hypothetical protein
MPIDDKANQAANARPTIKSLVFISIQEILLLRLDLKKLVKDFLVLIFVYLPLPVSEENTPEDQQKNEQKNHQSRQLKYQPQAIQSHLQWEPRLIRLWQLKQIT